MTRLKITPALDQEMEVKFSGEMEIGHEVISRALRFLLDITSKHQEETIAAISHNNTIRTILTFLDYQRFHLLPGLAIENTGFVLLERKDDNFLIKEIVGVL